MKGGVGGSGGAVTPRRSFKLNVENNNKSGGGDHGSAFTPGKKEVEKETPVEPALSSININAMSGRPVFKNRQSLKPNQATPKQIKQAQTPIKAPNGNTPTVVWNNAIFQSEEEEEKGRIWGPRNRKSSSDSDNLSVEISSCGIGSKKELQSKDKPIPPVESTPLVRPSIQNSSPDLESICSSAHVPTNKKQSAQPRKKVLFSKENTDQISVAGECEESEACVKDNLDSGIEEIEKEISRLTEKLNELKLQKAAKQQDQDIQGSSQLQKEVHSQKENCRRDECQGPKGEDPKSLEKQRRGRIVSAKFLQWDTFKKAEQKPSESAKKGRGDMSPKFRRRAASMGPAEHLKLSQLSLKSKEDEGGVQKSNNGSARKWFRGTENAKNVVGEKGSSRHVDVKARSCSLSPVPQRSIERKSSNLRPEVLGGSISARKAGASPLKNPGRSTQWLHPKKLFQVLDAKKSITTNNSSQSSKAYPNPTPQKQYPSSFSDQRSQKPSVCPDQQPQKPSPYRDHQPRKSSPYREQQSRKSSPNPDQQPQRQSPCRDQPPQKPPLSLKNARFVASRYGQAYTPSKEKSARTPQSSLGSLKNAFGKRFHPEDELEPIKGNCPSCKKQASSPDARNSDKILTPRSRTPVKSAGRLETKKTGGLLSKDGNPTGTPSREGATGKNSQQKGSLNKSAFANNSISVQVNALERDITTNNQETLAPDGTKAYFFSPGAKSPDTLERNRLRLPKIKTTRLTAQSPRNSGCIKREVDRIGKKSFFASDENVGTNPTDMKIADKASAGEIGDEIRHAFSFEDDDVEKHLN